MREPLLPKILKLLSGYYGVLQFFHLLLLTRAGWFLIRGQQIPFPAPPPQGGWAQAALPFLLGMGLVDVFAIGLGLVFVYSLLFRDDLQLTIGLISLTAAISSGIVYLIGTIPSGAWGANPLAYLAVLLLFSPVLPLYLSLIKQGFSTH
jgi:hypothetical protein